jgi:hypothetical protein
MARLAVLRAAGTALEHGPVAASSLDGRRAAFISPLWPPTRSAVASSRSCCREAPSLSRVADRAFL